MQITSLKSIIVAIYLPWIIAEFLQFDPVISYITAWIGSFIVFYLTLFSPLKYLSLDRPLKFQILRPIVLIQLIFAGFMCCTSIFYFIDHIGYEYFTKVRIMNFQSGDQTQWIARSQRITLLAHCTLVVGMILCTKPHPVLKYKITVTSQTLLFKICIAALGAATLLNYLPGFVQFKYMLIAVSISTSAYILVKGAVSKQQTHFIFGGCIFCLNFMNATLTGYKESIIINIILLGFMAFPFYKKTILLMCLPIGYILLYILPTFTTIIRAQSWIAGKTKETAREQAYRTFMNEENDEKIVETNWDFLTNRFSEIGMFTAYLKAVPEEHPYYEFDILINSCYALVPRIFWEDKPDTEKLAMERVYRLGVAHRSSSVSAKTRPVIDAYLSAGPIGVFIYMLFYGMLAQAICNNAEKLFGGYQLGCIILFNSIFQQMWRGNTLEFLLNNIFYGYLLMLIIHFILKKANILQPYYEDPTHHTIV
ncbi:MAG: hypothetical protein EOP48_05000 [Sphingobacteriales bacterium]|nr:MAG: hypothetical protein EOP48_05000 [Sphingobacteriales bacterium]